MSQHISDELPRLLTGDATHDVVMAAAEHLRTCPDCQQELVSSVVAHASLTSAHRFAPEVVAPTPTRESGLAPVTAIRGADDSIETDENVDAGAQQSQLPDMSSMFDQVRAEAAQPKSAPGRGRRTLLAVAAAVVVLVGGGTAIGLAVDGGSNGGQTVSLSHFDKGHGTGTATIDGDTITLAASSLPKLTSSQRYEVWLTDAARNHMYSIGFLGDGSSATFKVKHQYLAEFSAIEVSRQNNGRTTYSGTSVLRGIYA